MMPGETCRERSDILAGYAAASAQLVDAFEAIDPETLYAPVIDLLPEAPALIADIGAGTGRDAAWLAGRGHAVVAVEPVVELRLAGIALHPSHRIEWIDDRLPDLPVMAGRGSFGCVLLSGVWQHLTDEERERAIHKLRGLMAPGSTLILSLRHGPGAPGRAVYDVVPEATIADAGAAGLTLARRQEADSVQAANSATGVRWTWLAFTAVTA